MSESLFYSALFFVFLLSTEVVYFQRWHGWSVSHELAAISTRSVPGIPYNHAACRHFMQSHIRKMHAYLAVTCHPHFWQNDRGLLRATAVTRGWTGYRNTEDGVSTDS